MDEVEKMVKEFMEFPRATSNQVRMNTKMIVTLINQQERIIQVICKLHDIDFDELRKEVLSGAS